MQHICAVCCGACWLARQQGKKGPCLALVSTARADALRCLSLLITAPCSRRARSFCALASFCARTGIGLCALPPFAAICVLNFAWALNLPTARCPMNALAQAARGGHGLSWSPVLRPKGRFYQKIGGGGIIGEAAGASVRLGASALLAMGCFKPIAVGLRCGLVACRPCLLACR